MPTGSWVDFWNPNTPTNRGLLNPMFSSMTKELRAIFKQILQQHGVVFEQNGNMTFPENYQDVIPQIVEEFMRWRSAQPTEAVSEMPPRLAVCGGGCAVVKASSFADNGFPSWLDRSGWGVPIPKSQQKGSGCARGGCAVSESSDDTAKMCQHAGGKCRFHGTWGGCRNIHPENDPKTGELPEKGGPTVRVCRNLKNCQHGERCHYPHPQNDSCVIQQIQTSSGSIHIAKVCTLKKCKFTNCPCAHLPQDVIDKALERKKLAFSKSSRGGVACSAVACSDVADPAIDSDLDADLEVPSLTGELRHLSIVKPHCGGGAHVGDLPSHSGGVIEGDLLGLLDEISLQNGNEYAMQPLPSAPPLVLSTIGPWEQFIDYGTQVTYFVNNITGEVRFDLPNLFAEELHLVSHNPSASCAVVRRRKVRQKDASVDPKATKRPADSDFNSESSKKGRQ